MQIGSVKLWVGDAIEITEQTSISLVDIYNSYIMDTRIEDTFLEHITIPRRKEKSHCIGV